MTPQKLDKHIRCVKHGGIEAWFAYSTMISNWFPISTGKAAWIISMVPSLDVEIVIDWCRTNCYTCVSQDPETQQLLFAKEV